MIGQRIRRVEDRALVTGDARFTADLDGGPEVLYAQFVRSTLAHARVRHVDLTAAAQAPGVVAVYSGHDLGDPRGASPIPIPEDLIRPVLAVDVVRFVGEIVAVVVARTDAEAVDACELVVVDLEPLAVAADAITAQRAGALALFPAHGTNEVFVVEPTAAEAARRDRAFAEAALVIEVDMVNQRVAVAPMETNAVLAIPTLEGGLVAHIATQTPHAVRDGLATLCGLERGDVRVIATWVGGGFGAKSAAEPEYVLACKAALALGRPVRWRQSRTENLQAMHGRAQHQHVRLAAARDGTLLAVDVGIVSDNGAYPGLNHMLAGLTAKMLAGPYRVPVVTSSIRSVATNTAPVQGYRGAGRPEATELLERTLDIVAGELDLDPAEIRRRNLLDADAFPYTTPAGARYDCGDYHLALDRALEHARYAERRAEQTARRAAGDRVQLGIGLCTYVEVTAGAGPTEFADVEVLPDARVVVRVGTFGHGQGHHTTYAQIAADALGLPFASVRVIDGDTDLVARGFGTYGSRSMQVGGSAVHEACGLVVARARVAAADLLEAAPGDIIATDGGFAVAGVPSRVVGWAELATHLTAHPAASDERTGLFAEIDWARPSSTYPFGAHVAIVEVDTETGDVRLVEHVAVDDCGTLLNPMLVDGQVHGGIAQGAAQALYEGIDYDTDGAVRNATLAEYAFISAAELPSFCRVECVTPTPVNPLGAKGIGESGTIGATPAVHNAVLDALAPFGVRHLDMPCTPERVWRACQGEHVAVRSSTRNP